MSDQALMNISITIQGIDRVTSISPGDFDWFEVDGIAVVVDVTDRTGSISATGKIPRNRLDDFTDHVKAAFDDMREA